MWVLRLGQRCWCYADDGLRGGATSAATDLPGACGEGQSDVADELPHDQ